MTRVRSWEWSLLLSHQQSLEMKLSLVQEATGQEETVLIPGGKGRRSWKGSLPRERPLPVVRALSDATRKPFNKLWK